MGEKREKKDEERKKREKKRREKYFRCHLKLTGKFSHPKKVGFSAVFCLFLWILTIYISMTRMMMFGYHLRHHDWNHKYVENELEKKKLLLIELKKQESISIKFDMKKLEKKKKKKKEEKKKRKRKKEKKKKENTLFRFECIFYCFLL